MPRNDPVRWDAKAQRFRDSRGRFVPVRYQRVGESKKGTPKYRDPLGRFVSPKKVRRIVESRRARKSKQRLEKIIAAERRDPKEKQREKSLRAHEIAREYRRIVKEQAGGDIDYGTALSYAYGSVVRKMEDSYARPLRDWIGVKDEETGRVVAWRNKWDGEVIPDAVMARKQKRAKYETSIRQIALWRGMTIPEAKTLIAERYDGDWSDALTEESPNKGRKGKARFRRAGKRR